MKCWNEKCETWWSIHTHSPYTHHTQFRSLVVIIKYNNNKKSPLYRPLICECELLVFTCVPFTSVFSWSKMIVGLPANNRKRKKYANDFILFDLIFSLSLSDSGNVHLRVLHTCHTKNNIALVDFNILRACECVCVCARGDYIRKSCGFVMCVNEWASVQMALFLSLTFDIICVCVVWADWLNKHGWLYQSLLEYSEHKYIYI